MIARLKKWIYLKRARMAAKKYGLDFKHCCVFDHQLRGYGYPKHNQIVEVPMASGKTGLYLAKITHWYAGYEQKDWKFEFHGYK